jgi:hypothetical protein
MNRLLAVPLVLALLFVVAVPAFAASDLIISIDGSTLLSPGDTASFVFTTTASGSLVNPSTVTATLYFPNGVNFLPLTPINVATGVYMVSFAVADDAAIGFYAIVVSGSYNFGSYSGTAVKGFEVSELQSNILSAIGGLSGQISGVEDNLLGAVNSVTSLVTSVNGSVGRQFAATNTQLTGMQSALSGSISTLGTSISSLGTTVTGAITNSQSAITGAVTNSQTAVTGAITNSQTAVTGAVTSSQNSVQGSITNSQSSLTSAINTARDYVNTQVGNVVNNVQTWEYIILLVAVITLILAVILLMRKK